MTPAEIWGRAEAYVRELGFADENLVDLWCLAERAIGPDRLVWLEGAAPSDELSRLECEHGECFICIKRDLPIELVRHRIAFELARIELGYFGEMNEFEQENARIFAARVLVPTCLLSRARSRYGDDVARLAFTFNVPQKVISRRLREPMLRLVERSTSDKHATIHNAKLAEAKRVRDELFRSPNRSGCF